MKCPDCPIRKTCPERDALIEYAGDPGCCFGKWPKPHEVCAKAYCRVIEACHANSVAGDGTVAVYDEGER